ncbi:MAG: cation-transporting P-type ATPase [Prosthecobacter sp.]|jgi:cation-transporting ATPase F|uniref:cation-translocating P-type ATPase n=1 Tax=Prosthecobacter sp. TaxID=1965333 RepID=UPI0019EDDCD0|nr:cation-transporting P-type ATPase [Prosthecobacter sp.]MBE2284823.1 cation-transporting P-type ATPase [Prosthecobacter sp.]
MKQTSAPDSAARWHQLEMSEVVQMLKSDCQHGLSSSEVERRQKEYGLNVVTARGGTPAWKRFLQQFNQPLVYLLLAAAGVTAFLHEWVDSGVIFGVVLINAIIGFIQESKAEKAVDALSKMVVTEATVRRDGRRQRVPSAQLVPGDVVMLQSGDRVPADLRLFQVNSLQVDESPLTGESVPVQKHADPLAHDVVLADRKNQAFAGTSATYGTAEGLVWATGDKTETGRIAWLIADAVELSTPLTQKISTFSKLLLWIILGLSAAAFLSGVLRGEPVVDMFMAAVALAVGAIPEGLPAAVTIVLAIGVSRMAKRRAIIRKLPAVETLGSTTVICSDKTGTLTENQMTVQRVLTGGRDYEITGGGYDPSGEIRLDGEKIDPAKHPALLECLRSGVLCNDSLVVKDAEGRHGVQGDPTEAAMLVAGAKAGLIHEEMTGRSPRLGMIPFESEHMFRATLHALEGRRTIYKVGAVERLLDRCTDTLAADGSLVPLDKDAVRAAVEKLAAQGMRVLGFARRHASHTGDDLAHEHVKDGLTFLGLQGMIDPPRREAIAAVANCRRAGIRVKMITGDHAITARAIAEKLGIADSDGVQVMTGLDLEKVSDGELPEVAHRVDVFARVAPEQKLRLVRALQAHGHVVAMTGDGVNDAPALKQSDIGIAMGIVGTDVAKGAADMILTDDNFATIQAAVEEGRGVFDNLRKFIVWTLPTNVGEGSIILVAMLFGLVLPVVPVQLLWVNMATSIFLGLMLVFEPKEKDLMDRPPRDPKLPLLTFPLMMRTGLISLIMILGGYWLYFYETSVGGESIAAARTAVINVIVMVEVAYLMSCRSLNHSLLYVGLFSNPLALVGAAAMIGAQLLFTYAPFMQHLFHTAPLDAGAWLRIAGVTALSFAAVELEKWIRLGRHKGMVVPVE